MRFLLGLLLLTLIPAAGIGAVIKVPGDYAAIQQAVNAAKKGDTILVAPGIYKEHINFKGKAIVLRSDGDGLPSTQDPAPEQTVIDGEQSGSVVWFYSGEDMDSVLEGFTIRNGGGLYDPGTNAFYGGGICGIGTSPTIKGNIIRDNRISLGFNNGFGAGIYIRNGSPVIQDNIITENTISGGSGNGGAISLDHASPWIIGNEIFLNDTSSCGGGIHLLSSSPRIEDNAVYQNDANTGGGIYAEDSSPEILDNEIRNNSSYLMGGGVSLQGLGGEAKVFGNDIAGNSAGGGGGIDCWDAGAVISGNTIRDNSACSGAGIQCNGSAGGKGSKSVFANNRILSNASAHMGGGMITSGAPLLTCNLFFGNEAEEGGGLCLTQSPAAAVVSNTIFWNNVAWISGHQIALKDQGSLFIHHSDVKGGQGPVHVDGSSTLDWGDGMLNANPKFAGPGKGDFHILYSSPCRNAGSNQVSGLPAEDFDGNPRIAQGKVDMGCDEFHTHLYSIADASNGAMMDIKFVGLPSTAPVALFVGSGVLGEPLTSQWGDWYLGFPYLLVGPLSPIPAPDGVLTFDVDLTGLFPEPVAIPMQALIGSELTDLWFLEVE